MQIKAIESQSKYLGLLAFVGRSKQQVFDFVQDRVWKKQKGWKCWNQGDEASKCH